MGDHQSPGCHFHTQVGDIIQGVVEEQSGYQQTNLDIPRLPALFFMPTDAVEFMLGELWQREWPEVAARSTTEINTWRGYPKDRLRRLLAWQMSVLENTTATPWVGLKLAKPKPLLLCEER